MGDEATVVGIGALCLALLVLAVWQTRRVSKAEPDAREPAGAIAVADVRGDAERLCQQALRAVREDGQTPSRVAFAFEPASGGRTRVTVEVAAGPQPSELNPRRVRKRAALAEALADWLAEHGEGARVRHTG